MSQSSQPTALQTWVPRGTCTSAIALFHGGQRVIIFRPELLATTAFLTMLVISAMLRLRGAATLVAGAETPPRGVGIAGMSSNRLPDRAGHLHDTAQSWCRNRGFHDHQTPGPRTRSGSASSPARAHIVVEKKFASSPLLSRALVAVVVSVVASHKGGSLEQEKEKNCSSWGMSPHGTRLRRSTGRSWSRYLRCSKWYLRQILRSVDQEHGTPRSQRSPGR